MTETPWGDEIARIIREKVRPDVWTDSGGFKRYMSSISGAEDAAAVIAALPPSTGSARAEEWRRLTPDDARTPMLLYAPPEKLHSDPRGMPGELRYAKPCDFTWATLGLEINNPIPDDLKLPAPPSEATEPDALMPDPTPPPRPPRARFG